MNPGKLDRRITIQARTTTRGASGGVVVSFADDATVWAQKVDSNGREMQAAGALRAEAELVLRIRYRSTLTTQHRIYYGGQYYDILQINEEGRRASQLLQARTVASNVAAA